MKEIVLTKGYVTLVDDADYEWLSQWKWYLSGGYAISNEKRKKMHRLILNAKDGELVDHIDRNKLNNTRANLRIVDREGNVHNQKKRENTNNNYKGTQFIKRIGLWQARCRMYGNDYFLGYYKSEIAAAIAYNRKAAELSDCILLNEINLPIEKQNEILVSDLSQIIPAERRSEYDGVYWHKKSGRMKCGKWEAKIRVDGKYKSLGRYLDEQEARDVVLKFKITNEIHHS